MINYMVCLGNFTWVIVQRLPLKVHSSRAFFREPYEPFEPFELFKLTRAFRICQNFCSSSNRTKVIRNKVKSYMEPIVHLITSLSLKNIKITLHSWVTQWIMFEFWGQPALSLLHIWLIKECESVSIFIWKISTLPLIIPK